MRQYAVGRDDVLSALRGALEPLDHVQAMWEAGELAAKRERAERWFGEVLAAINDGPFTDDIERAAQRAQGGEDDG